MSDLRRLADDCDSELERRLLQAGASYELDPSVRVKTLAALGLAGVVTAASATAVASSASVAPPALASSSLLAKIGWFKATVGLASLGVLVGTPTYFAVRGDEQTPAVVAPALLQAPPPVARAQVPVPAEEVAELREPPAASVAAPRSEPRTVEPGAALRAELAALDAARARLSAGDAAAALSALDAYDRANPRGNLKLEAEVLRIDALARSGRGELARRRAQAFLDRHPKSVLASRVRRYTQD